MYGRNEPFLNAAVQAGTEALYQLDVASQERDKALAGCRWRSWAIGLLLGALAASWGYHFAGGYCPSTTTAEESR